MSKKRKQHKEETRWHNWRKKTVFLAAILENIACSA
jgi:hypothetical protein